MKTRATLLPGQNGTKELLQRYGDQLVCVRYRYDAGKNKRYKTIELIVDEKDWLPGVTIPAEKMVHVRVGFGETALREQVKIAGGYWDSEKKAWHLPYGKALQLGLEWRITDEEFDF